MTDDAADESTVAGLLSADGWAYASMQPVEAADPGRFHALFGRDSLIFALQLLHRRPDIARATLRALAQLQGRAFDPEVDEAPGKIVHEYRPVAPAWFVDNGWPVRDGGLRYYGTSDATSWYLIVLASCGDPLLQDELAAAWRRAARWLESSLDAGGGLVRCGPRRYSGGLEQTGWRDSTGPARDPHGGGIVHADGTTPDAPLADADSQAAAVAALRALQLLDTGRADHWHSRCEALRERVSTSFGPDVMALDGHDAVVSGAGSQLGWLLWADALDERATAAAASRLVEADILTPYGVRTLSSDHPAFRVDGYHRGAVWPFDCWLAWGGLRALGYSAEAEDVRTGVLEALGKLGHAPELYGVTTDGELEPIPIANRVQAWTVGAAIAFRSDWDGRASCP